MNSNFENRKSIKIDRGSAFSLDRQRVTPITEIIMLDPSEEKFIESEINETQETILNEAVIEASEQVVAEKQITTNKEYEDLINKAEKAKKERNQSKAYKLLAKAKKMIEIIGK